MGWKKLAVIFGFVLPVCSGMPGCGGQEKMAEQTVEQTGMEQTSDEAGEKRSVTKLIWQGEDRLVNHGAYFNRLLKEKNLPYEVAFVREEEAKDQPVDIRGISGDWQHTYDMTAEMLAGEFLILDEYLDSEEGKAIKESVPENVWDVFRVDGKAYTVLNVGFLPTKTVYIWDRKLAEKYDVHPEYWDEKIWEYEAELKKIWDGESKTGEFLTVQGLFQYGESLRNMTQILGLCYPFVINETDEMPKAELLYETPEYLEYLAGVQKLYESGIYDRTADLDYGRKEQPFLRIYTDFVTKDAYKKYWQLPEDYWDTHEVKELWEKPLWRLGCGVHETGIAAKSAHPKEAFSLLCRLYEDTELTNALMWGEEGKDYEVFGNTAEAPLRGGYIPAAYTGNNLIAYAEVGQDEKKKELYFQWLSESVDSAIAGFEFSGALCAAELERLYEIYEARGMENVSRTLTEENEALIWAYKDAGADTVIAEWNRQYSSWKEGAYDGIKD